MDIAEATAAFGAEAAMIGYQPQQVDYIIFTLIQVIYSKHWSDTIINSNSNQFNEFNNYIID